MQAQLHAVMSEQRCVVVDQRCRESEGKVKIEGYMSVSDEEAHHHLALILHYFTSHHTAMIPLSLLATLHLETIPYPQIAPLRAP